MPNLSYRAPDRFFFTALVRGLFRDLAAFEMSADDPGPPADPSIDELGACGGIQIEVSEVNLVCGHGRLSRRLRQDGDRGG